MNPTDFDIILDKYAELVLKVGVDLQKGQRLQMGSIPGRSWIQIPLDAAPLVRKITAKAYQMGAPLVEVHWGDQDLELIRCENAPRDSFQEMPSWAVKEFKESNIRKDAKIFIFGRNAYSFKDVDPEIIGCPEGTTLCANGMCSLNCFVNGQIPNCEDTQSCEGIIWQRSAS